MVVSPADLIRHQKEQDLGQVARTGREAYTDDSLSISTAVLVLQLDVDGLSAVKRSLAHSQNSAENHSMT